MLKPAHGDNVWLIEWGVDDGPPDTETLVDRWPILYVIVDTPNDQAALHRAMGSVGYVSTRLAVGANGGVHGDELWRFHHPDGPVPL